MKNKENYQKIKLTQISGVMRFYKKLIMSGIVSPNGSAEKRYQFLAGEYASGKRYMKDLRVEEPIHSNVATPVTNPAAAARSSKFLMI
jgi:hypothetical protein